MMGMIPDELMAIPWAGSGECAGPDVVGLTVPAIYHVTCQTTSQTCSLMCIVSSLAGSRPELTFSPE